MSSEEIKKCPFCGGNAKVRMRQKLYLGINEFGEKKIEFAHQVICNRCYARGPLVTHINYTGPHKSESDMKEASREAVIQWNKAWHRVMSVKCSECYI